MPKFFVEDKNIKEDKIDITNENVNHIKNVLRLPIDHIIEIGNIDTSQSYLCKICEIEKERIRCQIVEKIEKNTEATTDIHIFQGIPKLDKMELVIQKSTELGVKHITPVFMKRCIAKIEPKDENKKIDRWQKIAEVAAKQSGRNQIPIIHSVVNLKNICPFLKEYDIVIIAYEKEETKTLKQVIEDAKKNNPNKKKYKIAVIIGPEGGIAQEEIELLQAINPAIVTLGNRILRTETVALMMSSILIYELG